MTGSAPPARRTLCGDRFSQAAVEGRLELPVCQSCGAAQYPPRELCGQCLGDDLRWEQVAAGGVVLSYSTLSHSLNDYFAARLPWRIASVQLDAGGVAIAHAAAEVCTAGARARLAARQDPSGQGVLLALPESSDNPGDWEVLLADYRICGADRDGG